MEQDTAINQTPTSEVQTTPKQSNFLVTLLSILLLTSCLIAGFFAYQTQKLVKELTSYKIQQAQTPISTPAIVELPTPSDTPIATSSATPISTENIACTMEAKICPDGSAVGRSGPKCEFAPCPTPKN